MRNMHRELRPCPFCGGEKLRWHINYLSVTCENCGAYWCDSRKFSIDGWNNRATEDALNKRINELEAKPKWHIGHPKHTEQVIILVQYDYPKGDRCLMHEVDRWDFTADAWNKDKFNREILGWKEIEPFDLEIIEEGE